MKTQTQDILDCRHQSQPHQASQWRRLANKHLVFSCLLLRNGNRHPNPLPRESDFDGACFIVDKKPAFYHQTNLLLSNCVLPRQRPCLASAPGLPFKPPSLTYLSLDLPSKIKASSFRASGPFCLIFIGKVMSQQRCSFSGSMAYRAELLPDHLCIH